MTVAQTLGVVHGLVGSVKVVMEGAQWSHGCSRKFSEHCSSRWKGVNGWYQTGFGYVYRPKQIAPLLTLARSFSSPSVERNKQDETFVVYPLQFVARSNNILQVINCDGRFNTGSLLLIRRQIKTLFEKHDIKELQHGSSRALR